MTIQDLTVVILAAGNGTRMHSQVPKVLHQLAGQTFLGRVITTANNLQPEKIIVVCNPEHQETLATLPEAKNITWAPQKERRGTGHAAQMALPFVDTKNCLVLYGDVPLIPESLLKKLLNHANESFGMITASTPKPHGFGRIIRNEAHDIMRIIEQADASPEEQKIEEINTGIMVFPTDFLRHALPELKPQNAQGEYYLTDCVALWKNTQSTPVHSVTAEEFWHIQGVNTKKQLIDLERIWMQYQADRLLEEGVLIRDPVRFDCSGSLTCGQDVVIEPNVSIQGPCTLGNNCVIEAGVKLSGNCVIGDNTIIHANSIITNSTTGSQCSIGAHCILVDTKLDNQVTINNHSQLESSFVDSHARVGPYAYARPGTTIGESAKFGSFVEAKNTQIKPGASVAHFAYVGDCQIGEKTNIGAFIVHCNYHGPGKPKAYSSIGDHAFIGAGTQIVGPAELGNGCIIGAGSTVRGNVDDNELYVDKKSPIRKEDWSDSKKLAANTMDNLDEANRLNAQSLKI